MPGFDHVARTAQMQAEQAWLDASELEATTAAADWEAPAPADEAEIVSPMHLRASQWGRCGLCETNVQLLLNGLINTWACGSMQRLFDAAAKIPEWGQIVKTGADIFCGICRGVTNGQCTWRSVATNACRRHGFCT